MERRTLRGLPVKQYIIFFTNNEWIITPLIIATVDKCSNLNHFTVSYLNLENANCKSDLHEINITNHIYMQLEVIDTTLDIT